MLTMRLFAQGIVWHDHAIVFIFICFQCQSNRIDLALDTGDATLERILRNLQRQCHVQKCRRECPIGKTSLNSISPVWRFPLLVRRCSSSRAFRISTSALSSVGVSSVDGVVSGISGREDDVTRVASSALRFTRYCSLSPRLTTFLSLSSVSSFLGRFVGI